MISIPPGVKVAFIGDSYTSGHMLPEVSQRWSSVICATNNWVEWNGAVAGAGYINTGAGGASAFKSQAAGIPQDAGYVFVLGGINDAGMLPTPAALKTAVVETMDAISSRVPDAEIVVISPMWFSSQPSSALLSAESVIRSALPDSISFIEGGPWLRFGRGDLEYYDGHPNPAGAKVIASWVMSRMGSSRTGATSGAFIRPGNGDAAFSGTGVRLSEGVILDAAPGWWEIQGIATLYGSTPGFVFAAGNTATFSQRSDSNATVSAHTVALTMFHPGGDLTIAVGYSANSTVSVCSNASTRVSARRLSE